MGITLRPVTNHIHRNPTRNLRNKNGQKIFPWLSIVISLAFRPQAGITCVIASLSRESEKSNSLAALVIFHFPRSPASKLASTASNEKRTDGAVSALAFLICDPAGIRTQDPYIKSVMLYQLSYEILPFTLL